jgi:hypothetical protein
MTFVGVLQTIVLTLKSGLFPNCKKPQQRPNCEIRIVWPQFIQILNISLKPMSMGYHTCESNRQLSKPRNHFLAHLQPWKCNFHMIHFVMDNT